MFYDVENNEASYSHNQHGIRAMNFADLQVFKSVVYEGGVIKAASKLHRVPSAVTTRIKQLEASMGVKLFHRNKQRLDLSPAGELLLD